MTVQRATVCQKEDQLNLSVIITHNQIIISGFPLRKKYSQEVLLSATNIALNALVPIL